jgi:hypothetical protein
VAVSFLRLSIANTQFPLEWRFFVNFLGGSAWAIGAFLRLFFPKDFFEDLPSIALG